MFEERECDILIIGFYNCILTRFFFFFLGIYFTKSTVFFSGLDVVFCFVKRKINYLEEKLDLD